MKYLTNICQKAKGTITTGLALLVLQTSSPAYAGKHYCRKWNFKNETREVCMSDNNSDGKADWIMRLRYDQKGNLVEEVYDHNGDGKDDEVCIPKKGCKKLSPRKNHQRRKR